jgi:LAT3 family solute carrier family 43 protein 3
MAICASYNRLVYGWPALRQQLQDDGSNLSEKNLGAIFTVGAWSTQGLRFFTGLARDRFGTQWTVAVCMVLVISGILGVGWSDPNNAISLGASMLAVGCGSGVQLCVQPVAGLFPQNTGLVLTTLSGGFQISGSVFLALTSVEVQRQVSFSGFAVCLLALTLAAIILFPKGKSFILEDSILVADDENASSKEDSKALTGEEFGLEDGTAVVVDNNEAPSATLKSSPTAIEQIKSTEYFLLCAWFSICLVPLQYYVGSIGFQLEEKGDDGFYTDLFSITFAGATAVAAIGGYLADRLGLGITQGLATLLVAMSLLILAFDNISLNGQIAGMILYGIGRMFMFGMYFSNTGLRFGYDNYGTLAGLGLLVSGCVSLLQYPLIALAVDGKAAAVNIGLAVALLALFPYFIWLHQREKSIH